MKPIKHNCTVTIDNNGNNREYLTRQILRIRKKCAKQIERVRAYA